MPDSPIVSANGNSIVPNSHNFPNLFTDRLMYYLSGEEWKVLSMAVREILGWRKHIDTREACISLSQFHSGKVSRETGADTCYGTGLSRPALVRALEALARYRVLIPVGAPTEKGQRYHLQESGGAIDWDGLEQRDSTRIAAALVRTEKARTTPAKPEGGKPDLPQDMAVLPAGESSEVVNATYHPRSVALTTPGKSDLPTESHPKANPKARELGADAPPASSAGIGELEPLPEAVYSGEVKNGKRLVDPVRYALWAAQRNAERNGGEVIDTSAFPEVLQEFARVFILTSGYRPLNKSEVKFWTQTFSEARGAGATPEMFKQAVADHLRESLSMDGPQSVLYRVRGLIAAPQQKKDASPAKPRPVNITAARLRGTQS